MCKLGFKINNTFLQVFKLSAIVIETEELHITLPKYITVSKDENRLQLSFDARNSIEFKSQSAINCLLYKNRI